MSETLPDEELLSPLKLFPLEDALVQQQQQQILLQKHNSSYLIVQLNASTNDSFEYLFNSMEGCYNGEDIVGHLLTMVLYVLVCIVGLFGNTLVIYVVLRYSKMQTITNVYILNLAIADECFLIGIPFLLYTMQIGSWQFGEYMCKAYMVSTSITQFTSSIFLLIMSADRYIAVCHPISSPRYRTPFISKIVSCLAWLTSVLFMLPVILFASTVQNGERISCNIKWPEEGHTQSGTTFILYTLSLGFATPLFFILCFYYLVIHKLRNVGPQHKSKEKKRSHRKVTRLVLTVITVYILCWLPYWISQLLLITTPPSVCATRWEITAFLLVGCLGYSNSAMNPFLYAFLSENFKKSFRKAFTCIVSAREANASAGSGAEFHVKDNNMFSKLGKKGRKLAAAAAARQQRQHQRDALLPSDSNTTTLLTTNTTYGTGTTATNMTMAETLSDVSPTEITNANSNLAAAADGNNAVSVKRNSNGNGNNNVSSNNKTCNAVTGNASNAKSQKQNANEHENEHVSKPRPPVLHTDL